jgi:hypothetical protein
VMEERAHDQNFGATAASVCVVCVVCVVSVVCVWERVGVPGGCSQRVPVRCLIGPSPHTLAGCPGWAVPQGGSTLLLRSCERAWSPSGFN